MTARWIAIVLLALTAPAAPLAASDPLGSVKGRAYEESRQRDAPDQPAAGTVVTVLPRSEAFLRELEEIKGRARTSIAAYRGSASAIRRARDAYERRLWEDGAADRVRATTVGADGTFTIDDLPLGAWLLVAIRSTVADTRAQPLAKRDAKRFALGPRTVGYHTVSMWLVEFTISGGRAEVVELTDRNVWFTGVVEKTEADAGR